LRMRGRLDEAEPLLERALALREASLGAAHPAVAAALHELGWIRFDKADYASAAELFRRATEIREESQGADHPAVAGSLQGLGASLRNWGLFSKAGWALERRLRSRKGDFGR